MTIDEYNKNPNRCKFCNSIISFNSKKRVRNRKFCNVQCSGKYFNLQSLQKYLKNPILCERCKTIIPYKKRKMIGFNKYCSNKCSVSSTNSLRFTDEVRKKIGEKQKIIQSKIWNEQKRKEHSKLMSKIRDDNPESYSSENVCGRVKPIKLIDSYGNDTKCLGGWEVLVAKYFDSVGIRWINKIEENFQYYWNNSNHRYFPDFYLPDKNVYVEVKGFERDRDRAKWKQFPKKLVVIKLNEIKQIQKNSYTFNA